MSDYQGGLEAVCNNIAVEMQQWAVANHQWHNQTGALERSIGVLRAQREGNATVFGIGEGMSYAVYVEARKDKGVLQQTIDHFLPQTKRDVAAYSKAFIAQEARRR